MKNKKRLLMIGLIGLSSVALVACGDEQAVELSQEEIVVQDDSSIINGFDSNGYDRVIFNDIVNVVIDNIQDLANEDIDKYLEDFIYNEKTLDTQRTATQETFDSIDAEYELLNVKLLNLTDGTAKVEIEKVIRATDTISSNIYRDNKTIVVSDLIFTDNRWKFTESSIKEIVYLN